MTDYTFLAARFPATIDHLIGGLAQLETMLDPTVQPSAKRGQAAGLLQALGGDLHMIQGYIQHLTRTKDQIQALVHISALINSSLEVDKVLEEVADAVNRLTLANRTYLMLRQQDSHELTIRAARDSEGVNLSRKEVVYSRSVVDDVLRKGNTILVPDAQAAADLKDRDSVIRGELHSILCIPLTLRGEVIGVLYADNHHQTDIFDESLIPMLTVFGNQAAIAIENATLFQQVSAERDHAVQLMTDLQQSRERIVTAREEERRQLGRNLHDDLGPALDSVILRIGNAKDLLLENPDQVDDVLTTLQTQTQDISKHVRALAHDLRPPALGQLGLIRALREYAAGLNRAQRVKVIFDAPENLPGLSAAVDIAAYRIVLEALTNVIRHANARHCWIKVEVTAIMLHLEVRDDGQGFSATSHPGVGLTSMRERATELGGNCRVESVAQGVRIVAEIPLRKVQDDNH